jgi:hypothetical protein
VHSNNAVCVCGGGGGGVQMRKYNTVQHAKKPPSP